MIKVLMVEDDETVCSAFEIAIHNHAKFMLVAKTGSQTEAMQILKSEKIDVILLDLELEEGDGIHLLDDMRRALKVLLEIITVTNTSSEAVLSCVREKGSDFIYQKQNGAYSPVNVLEIIEMTLPYYKRKLSNRQQRLAAEYNVEREKEYRQTYVEHEIEKLGFRPKKKGTIFISEAICMLLDAKVPENVQITNDIYPKISRKHQSSIGSVEKCIRNAIERVWQNSELALLKTYYPFYWDPNTGRPTNAEFIKNMAAKLKE